MNAPGTKRLLRKEVLGWCAFDFANTAFVK